MIRIHRMACGFVCEGCGAKQMFSADVTIDDRDPLVSPYASIGTQSEMQQTAIIQAIRDELIDIHAPYCGPIRVIGLHLASV